MDYSAIKGQEACKRAICIALAGGHVAVLVGPSGHGKSMLVDAAKGIDPEFKAKEITIRLCRCTRPKELESMQRYPADMHIEVPSLPFREWAAKRPGTSSADISRAIKTAREFSATISAKDNALTDGAMLLAKQAYTELGMTPRGMDAAVRVARTIANLDQSKEIREQHIAEAIQYRLFDRHV